MESRLDLKQHYDDHRNSIQKELVAEFGDDIEVDSEHSLNENFVLVLSLSRIIERESIKLYICFTEYFPDDFPDIYIFTQNNIIPRIPHVDSKGFVCTVNKEQSRPDVNDPFGVTKELIEKAKEIYRDGIKGCNLNDFQDEFLAYWSLNALKFNNIYTMFSPNKSVQVLDYIYKKSKGLIEGYIYDNETKLNQLLLNKKQQFSEFKSQKVLYIPFVNHLLNPYENRVSEFHTIVRKIYNRDLDDLINEHYKISDEHCLFLSSIENKDEIVLFGWEPERNQKYNGFRKGKIEFYRGVFQMASSSKIKKYAVERLDKERIFNRVGSCVSSIHNKKIMVTGCGSLGSHMINALSKSGISKFLLVDEQLLQVENIARHLCGYTYVDEYKVEAIKDLMTKHFPFLEFDISTKNILSLIIDDPGVIEDVDFNIVAIGKTNIELRIDQTIKKDVIYIWVETFAAVGHAVYIPADSSIRLKDFFNDKLQYKLQVILNSSDFYTNEAGCQTTFLPYSFSYLESFISIISAEVLKHLENTDSEAIVYVWINNLNDFEDYNFDIRPSFEHKQLTLNKYSGDGLLELINENNI